MYTTSARKTLTTGAKAAHLQANMVPITLKLPSSQLSLSHSLEGLPHKDAHYGTEVLKSATAGITSQPWGGWRSVAETAGALTVGLRLDEPESLTRRFALPDLTARRRHPDDDGTVLSRRHGSLRVPGRQTPAAKLSRAREDALFELMPRQLELRWRRFRCAW